MKRFIKHLSFIFILISTLIIIDYNATLQEVEAGDSPVPTSIRVEKNSDTSLKLSWNKVSNISSYEIYLKTEDSYTYITSINNPETTSWIHENLSPNEEYTYVIKTRNLTGAEGDYSNWVSMYLGDSYTNLKSISFNNAPTEIEINKNINLSVFLNLTKENENLELVNDTVRWYTSNKDVATIDENGIITTKKTGEITVGVIGHNGIDNHYTLSVFEKKQNINQTPVAPISTTISYPTDIKATRVSSHKVKLTWTRVTGANKYEIYRKIKGTYYKIATVNGNSYTEKKLKKNKQYYYKIRAVKVINKKEYKSSMSKYVSCYTSSKNNKYTNLKKIKFYMNSKTIMEKQSIQLKYIIITEKNDKTLKNKKLRWWTSNSEVATVDKHGKVTAKSFGKVTIYVKGHNGVTAKYKLNIDSKYAGKIPILTFHRIVSDQNKKTKYPEDQWVASVKDFEKQMKYLHDNNYKTISASEFENWFDKKKEYSKKTVMITFDDGDYELYYLVYPILKKYNFKATAFIIGSYTGEFTMNLQDEGRYRLGKDLINRISLEYPNLQFESHTYNLHYRTSDDNPIVTTKSYQEIMNDFENNKSFGFKYLAYPYGVRTPEFIKAAQDSGMHMAFKFGTDTYATRNNPRYEIARVKINGQITYNDYVKKMEKYLK